MQENNLILFGVIILLVLWIIFQQITTQRVKPVSMWRIPLGLAIVSYLNLQPSLLNDPVQMTGLISGLLAGGLAGLVRSGLNRVNFEPATGRLVIYGSMLGLLFWLGFVATEVGLRYVVNQGSFTGSSAFGTALPLVVLTGFFGGWRGGWYLKYLKFARAQY